MTRASLVAILGLALAACGGGGKQQPATTSENLPGTEEGGHEEEAPGEEQPADMELDEAGYCCCALPSDPETYDRMNPDTCHEDEHGTCTELAQCGDD